MCVTYWDVECSNPRIDGTFDVVPDFSPIGNLVWSHKVFVANLNISRGVEGIIMFHQNNLYKQQNEIYVHDYEYPLIWQENESDESAPTAIGVRPRPLVPLSIQSKRSITRCVDEKHVNWRDVFDKTPLPEEVEIQTPLECSVSTSSLSANEESDSRVQVSKRRSIHGRNSYQNVVDHDYIDYSQVDDKDAEDVSLSITGTDIRDLLYSNKLPLATPAPKPESCKVAISEADTFPKKLFTILSIPQYRNIICWLPHGRSFVIHDPMKLSSLIFPRFFKLKKYNSFIRQLSLWGFKRITNKKEAKSYYSPFFLRGKPCLLARMRLILVKGTGKKLKSNPAAEPNFSQLSKIRPLPDTDECVEQWYQMNIFSE